jgi:hypothetical protein
MKVEDLRPHGAGWTVKLGEKGGKQHGMPCHHALAEVLRAYIDPPASPRTVSDGCSAPGGHNGSALSDKPMSRPPRRGGRHRRAGRLPHFRATRITAYLADGGALEHAQEMAAH